MIQLFFPSSIFAWAFSGGLLALLCAASWSDMRRMLVPKWITLTTLILGAVASMGRGAWLGGAGLSTWLLGPNAGIGLGMLDGLLFALAGVLVAFLLMFGIWILGVCGGGDVKLYAAVGAWVGPVNIFPVLGFAAICLVFVGIGGAVVRLLRGKSPAAASGNKPPKNRLVAFSWPLALGTLLVLAFLLGSDQLAIRSALTTPNPVPSESR